MALKVRHDTFEKNFSCKDLASSSSMLLSFGAVYVFFMGEPHEHPGFLPSWLPAENTTLTSHLHLEFEQIQRSPSRIVMLSVSLLTRPRTLCRSGLVLAVGSRRPCKVRRLFTTR